MAEVPKDTIESFRRDGACVLRGVFGGWIEVLRKGVARNLAEPSADVKIYQGKDGAGRFVGDYCNWDRIPEYRDFIFNSDAAAVGRALMGTRTSPITASMAPTPSACGSPSTAYRASARSSSLRDRMVGANIFAPSASTRRR